MGIEIDILITIITSMMILFFVLWQSEISRRKRVEKNCLRVLGETIRIEKDCLRVLEEVVKELRKAITC